MVISANDVIRVDNDMANCVVDCGRRTEARLGAVRVLCGVVLADPDRRAGEGERFRKVLIIGRKGC